MEPVKSERKGKKRTPPRGYRKTPLEPEEADDLYDACKDDLDRLIVGVLVGCGLRVSEFVALNQKSVLHQQDRLRVMGKGKKTRIVPLTNPRAKALLITWFVSRNSIGVGVRAVQKRMKRLKKAAGITRTCTPHILRHTFARDALARGINIRALARPHPMHGKTWACSSSGGELPVSRQPGECRWPECGTTRCWNSNQPPAGHRDRDGPT